MGEVARPVWKTAMATVLGGKFNGRFRMESFGVTFGTIDPKGWQA